MQDFFFDYLVMTYYLCNNCWCYYRGL